jgi:hypothetical protein
VGWDGIGGGEGGSASEDDREGEVLRMERKGTTTERARC